MYCTRQNITAPSAGGSPWPPLPLKDIRRLRTNRTIFHLTITNWSSAHSDVPVLLLTLCWVCSNRCQQQCCLSLYSLIAVALYLWACWRLLTSWWYYTFLRSIAWSNSHVKYMMSSGSAIPDHNEPTEKKLHHHIFQKNFHCTFSAEVLKGADTQDQQ